MATYSDINKKAMIDALEKTLGIVTTACRIVGIARSTHYEWYNSDPDYRAAVDSISDICLDVAESKLFKKINEDEDITAIIFYLKTKGKKRGYGYVDKYGLVMDGELLIKFVEDGESDDADNGADNSGV